MGIEVIDATPALEHALIEFFVPLIEVQISGWRKKPLAFPRASVEYFFETFVRRVFQKEKREREKFVMVVGIKNFYALFLAIGAKHLGTKGGVAEQIVEISFEMRARQFPFLCLLCNRGHEERLEDLIDLLDAKKKTPDPILNNICDILIFADMHCKPNDLFKKILENYKKSTISVSTLVFYLKKEISIWGEERFAKEEPHFYSFEEANLSPVQCLAIAQECQRQKISRVFMSYPFSISLIEDPIEREENKVLLGWMNRSKKFRL